LPFCLIFHIISHFEENSEKIGRIWKIKLNSEMLWKL
jgi:hypothetical protein